jgi:xanthine dehydrogenase molybdopterin-binding subunit B
LEYLFGVQNSGGGDIFSDFYKKLRLAYCGNKIFIYLCYRNKVDEVNLRTLTGAMQVCREEK